jgi:hypothetical protein
LVTDIAFGTIRDQGFESYAIYYEVSNLHLQFTKQKKIPNSSK